MRSEEIKQIFYYNFNPFVLAQIIPNGSLMHLWRKRRPTGNCFVYGSTSLSTPLTISTRDEHDPQAPEASPALRTAERLNSYLNLTNLGSMWLPMRHGSMPWDETFAIIK